uniref:Uncharacterized protein n=1 Tax=Buteo japonicus TaxID=224669 RepID=A0A8C0BF38_9AVES
EPRQCCVPVLQSLKSMGSTTGERLGEKKQQTVATWPFLGGYFAVWPWSIFHWWLCPLPAFWRNGSGACVPLHPGRTTGQLCLFRLLNILLKRWKYCGTLFFFGHRYRCLCPLYLCEKSKYLNVCIRFCQGSIFV